MSRSTRREFVKSTGAAIVAGSVSGGFSSPSNADDSRQSDIPPHRSLPLQGVHAYTDRMSVAAGDSIRFHISSTHSYRFEACRLGLDVDGPTQDEVLKFWQVDDPEMQPIHPGSYIHVENGLPHGLELEELTLECWVRLWNLNESQCIISQRDENVDGGFALIVNPDASLVFNLGERSHNKSPSHQATSPGALTKPGEKMGFTYALAKWHHVVATFAAGQIALWVDGKCLQRWDSIHRVRISDVPLRIGAIGRNRLADRFLDADISLPTIYDRALNDETISQRFAGKGLVEPTGRHVIACWPLDEERGDRAADSSGNERHGRIVNHATWMIGGPAFQAAVGAYAEYNPLTDRTRGHGLRLASDDLYDCRWKPTFQWRIPKSAKSGVFAGRIRFEENGEQRIYHTLFIVRKPVAAKKAPIALLFSTNTWRAYSATPFCPTWPGVKASVGNQGYMGAPRDPQSAFSFYRHHAAGQPAYQLGLKMPWPVAGPYTFLQSVDVGYSHLCRADRFTQVWLERQGYSYDAISDLDLQQDPDLLSGYKVLIIVGHNEYWSRTAYDNVARFLESGGNLISLSGNTMYWRVSFDSAGSVMECRKTDAWGAQLRPEQRGESWHSHDRQRGGAPRDCGFPAWELIGVEFMSNNALGTPGAGPFRVVTPGHFLFQSPHRIQLNKGDQFGHDPDNSNRQPIGHESDVRVSTLMKLSFGPPPPEAPVGLTDPAGIELLAEGVFDWNELSSGGFRDYYHRVLPAEKRVESDVACEMIYWQRPAGGRVFCAPSIAAGWPLDADPRWSALLQNVLHHFGVPG